ncbi:MAG: flagellar basal-body MS-ring/collar protein FliF [Dehalococcoidia bacterium]
MAPFAGRILEAWADLSPVRKGLLTASGLGLAALLVAVYSWSATPSYVTLYTGLDGPDSGVIVEQLRTQGVKYELDAGGTTVRVPASQVDDLRVAFASQGLPQGGHTGFEVFSGNSFTATDFVQQLNFQRGLQGELERTLEVFPAVEQARVHVVLPERSLFRDDQQAATASVVLSLRPGRGLQEHEVDGMAHLVAGAVEGLQKDRISILDTTGRMIYDGAASGADGGFGAASSQLGLQSQYQRELEAGVQSMLDRALGAARSSVNVRAALNFDRVETETETYRAPDEGTPRSTHTTTETYTTGLEDAAGEVPGALPNVPGANANLPGVVEAVTEAGATNYQRAEVTSNFELDRMLTREIAATGGVQRLSVSLLLDESIPQAQAEALQQSVSAAVGLDEARGDAMVMTRVPFDRTAIDEAAEAFASEASRQELLTYVRMALPFVLLLLAFVFFRLLIRSVSKRAVRAYEVAPDGLTLARGSAGGSLGFPEQGLHALPAPVSDEIKRSDLEVSVLGMAHSNPETVAEVVQSWLREE